VPALEHRDARGARQARAHRVDDERQVARDDLPLQREGRGGDDDLLVVVHRVRHRRDEVAQRLARAGTGLDEQVLPGVDRGGDRAGHLVLPLAVPATESRDGEVEQLVDLRRGVRRRDRLWHRDSLVRAPPPP